MLFFLVKMMDAIPQPCLYNKRNIYEGILLYSINVHSFI